MTSDDPSAFGGMFSSVPDLAAGYTGTGYSAPAISAGYTGGADYSKTFLALARGLEGVNAGIKSFGEGRALDKQAALSRDTARLEAESIRLRGRRLVSTARAVTGAQGSPVGEGSPLLAELNLLQQAERDASARIYGGAIDSYLAKKKAKQSYMRIPSDLAEGAINTYQGYAGASLLTGRKP